MKKASPLFAIGASAMLRALIATACLGILSPAIAQTSEQARTETVVMDAGTVEGFADLDFGRVISPNAAGTVRLSPGATATCTPSAQIIRTSTCRAARFEGQVTVAYLLQVTGPAGNAITLTGPGGKTMQVRNFTFAAGPGTLDLGTTILGRRFLVTDLGGNFVIYAGATLDVAALQEPGIYNGTFEISLNYN